jgi:hypothetical protein
MITSEKTIVGNLVGTYAELVELMALADRGLVKLDTREYKLSAANDALHDLHVGKVNGRAVLIPWVANPTVHAMRRVPSGATKAARAPGERACLRGRS